MDNKQKKFSLANQNPFSALAYLCVALFIFTQYMLVPISGITALFIGSVLIYFIGAGGMTRNVGSLYMMMTLVLVIYVLLVDILDHQDTASDPMRNAMLYQLLYCFLIYLYCSLEKKNINRVFLFMTVSIAVMAFTLVTDENFIRILEEGAEEYEYFTKDETNRNVIGMIVGTGAFFFFHLTMTKKKLFVIPTILLVFIGLLTGSRKAVFAALVGILVYSYLHLRSQKGKHKKGVGIILIVFLILVILMYLCYANETLYNIIGQRIEGFFGTWFGGESTEASARIRSEMTDRAMDLFWEKPVFGWGIEGFALNTEYGVYSHNNYTEVLANFGIVGFLIFYVYKFVILIQQFRLIKFSESQEERSLNIFLAVWLLLTLLLDFGAVSINSVTANMAFAVAAAQQLHCRSLLRMRSITL